MGLIIVNYYYPLYLLYITVSSVLLSLVTRHGD